ncbi:hypothetical protein HPB48_018699 [Haemaphysalis longicornis]|uniref:Alpha-2-macroglobulin bait region domain-containing protein n=1 Tax=Haemaphysalis longicornis TaxID=44386 RepID=A0A9J6GVH0_HAELO|nr:hypothetical protein HPB48_018699 [Haemaphysalis longicornis]
MRRYSEFMAAQCSDILPVSSGGRGACLIVQLETADERFPAGQQAHTVIRMLPYKPTSRKDIIIERKDPKNPLQLLLRAFLLTGFPTATLTFLLLFAPSVAVGELLFGNDKRLSLDASNGRDSQNTLCGVSVNGEEVETTIWRTFKTLSGARVFNPYLTPKGLCRVTLLEESIRFNHHCDAMSHMTCDDCAAIKRPAGQKFDAVLFTSHVQQPTTMSAYYAVVSRGRVLKTGKVHTDQGVIDKRVTFPVTPEMSPSFRVIVVAMLDGELVVDAVYARVEPACTEDSKQVPISDFRLYLQFSLSRSTETTPSLLPGAQETLIMKGKPGTRIGLLGVDQAVYLLRRKDMLTRDKVSGCTETTSFLLANETCTTHTTRQ